MARTGSAEVRIGGSLGVAPDPFLRSVLRRADRAERIVAADAYLAGRTGCYPWRRKRYDAVAATLPNSHETKDMTLVDVGSGWGELARCLYAAHGFKGRYIPVDACIDGTDLETWTPPRQADWFVALEVIEHLHAPAQLLHAIQRQATRGVIVSTPNPETTDVLGMDPTHRTPVSRAYLELAGFRVDERSFYGAEADSLFGVWLA